MVRGRRNQPEIKQTGARGVTAGQPLAISIGPLLLDLRDALQRAERCRVALRTLGYSRERWQEIVRDVNPEIRFALRPQMLDAIITYLESINRPISRNSLTNALYMQRAGSRQRIRQSITANLRCGNLAHFPGYKVGLPTWEEKE